MPADSSAPRRTAVGAETNVIDEAYVDAEVHSMPGIQAFRSFALTPSGSAHLDLIRAAAAWAVMWGHLRGLFFVDFPDISHQTAWLGSIYFLTGFGHQAVMVFFVLSGFFISSAILKRHAMQTWSWADYAIDRMTRLYVVLIPGLLFGLLWDFAGSRLFAWTGLYSHPLPNLGYGIAQAGLTVKDFLGNIFFLQTIVCATFGSNAPLWSLANEFWYYVLFPVALSAGFFWASRSWRRAVTFTILTLAVAIFVGPGILIPFLVWLAGCALAFAYVGSKLESRRWLIAYFVASSIALAACLAAARVGNPRKFFGGDIYVGSAFALFLFGVLQLNFSGRSDRYSQFTHRCAGFSYSLYVLHFPLLLFLRAWLAPAQRWQPDAAHLIPGALIGMGVLAFAWLVSLVTEDKTHLVRKWVRRRALASVAR